MVNSIDLARVDLNLLVLFDVVMAERHVGRTAQRLHLSPSAISHGLGRLRRLLNDPLFLKTPKGVVPTGRAIELAAQIASQARVLTEGSGGSEPFAVVFAAVGITHREASYFMDQFRASDAMDRTVLFINRAARAPLR